jgi:ATP-binding cassette subfamily B multidrug efflux pump
VSAPVRRPPGGGFGPARMMRGPMPTEKLKDFKGSSRRVLAMLRPDRLLIAAVLVFGIAGVALSVVGPRLLGHATDVIFSGVVGRGFDAGVSKQEAVDELRRAGADNRADMLAAMDVVPGQGIDFPRLGQILAWVVLVYLFASLFGVLQGRLTATVVQRAVHRLRGCCPGPPTTPTTSPRPCSRR